MKKILAITGKSNIHEVWPNLELYIHGGMNFSPYEKTFNDLFPDSKMNYVEAYNSSEGYFRLQDQVKSKTYYCYRILMYFMNLFPWKILTV